MAELSSRQQTLIKLGQDRRLAHKVLFKHRHPHSTPQFILDQQDDWHSDVQYLCELSFRGSAKSSTAEEALIIKALYQDFRNAIVFGASEDLACERLMSVRKEFERNPIIHTLFGDMRGAIWTDGHIELSNGRTLRARGRGSAMRGTKDDEIRPDLVLFDDIEDREELNNPRQREKIQAWVFADVLPAMTDPSHRMVRICANALHPDCLAIRLKNAGEAKSGFKVRVTPWVYIDENGERQSAWPDRYPLSFIDKERQKFYALGRGMEYEAEYMCDPSSPESKAFKDDMLRVVYPRVRTWQAAYSMTDPARTTGKTAATTGHAVWSWIGPKLVVWDATAAQLMPDAIIEQLFDTQARYKPVAIGFEEDGLNQWALQPIRQEMIRRGDYLPLKPVKAPKGKFDFIRTLQVYFQAREIEFAKELPELKTQLLGFPQGPIDAPNALAYAIPMRPGAPVYDEFSINRHVMEDLQAAAGQPTFLCLNATRAWVTAVAVQAINGSLRVLADGMREGEPAAMTAELIRDMQLLVGRSLRYVCGPVHFSAYNNVGLVQAVKRLPAQVQTGVDPDRGRVHVHQLLQRERGDRPQVLVSSAATLTLNGFSAGYARAIQKQGGELAAYAEDNIYRLLMEGLESFVGLMEVGSTDDDSDARMNAVTRDGRSYTSMLGNR